MSTSIVGPSRSVGSTERALVGRRREIDAIEGFLADGRDGFAVLCLEGEPGVGKSTLWELALDRAGAEGARILRCRPAAAEQSLALGGLVDLVGGVVDDVTPQLPGPHAVALRAALGLVDATTDARILSLGLTGAIRTLATRGPLVVAVDDSQWLDASTAALLAYALRRLEGTAAAFLVARRAGDDDGLGLRDRSLETSARFLRVDPLDQDDLGSLVLQRLGIALPRPAVRALHEASGGNPFYALEIARGSSVDDLVAGRRTALPSTLRALVQGRLGTLSDVALDVVLAAAALPRPTVSVLASALGSASRVDDGLAEAEDAEVLVTTAGAVRFLHPLLASTVYTTTAATRRRVLHGRLAEVVDDPVECAHHLALAASGVDAHAAGALEAAARLAADRGGSVDAARLADEAVELTPPDDAAGLRSRLFLAAGFHFESGTALAAKAALERAVACSASAPERAEALRRLAGVLRSTDGVQAAIDAYEAALELAADDPQLRASIHQALAWMRCFQGSVEGTRLHATAALRAIEEAHDPDTGMLMEVVASVAESQFHAGLDEYRATIERALDLERECPGTTPVSERPSAYRASHLVREDDLDTARITFERLLQEATAKNDEPSRIELLVFLGTIAAYACDLETAQHHLDTAHTGAVQSGQEALEGASLGWRTLVHGLRGDVDAARHDAEQALRIALDGGSVWLEARVRGHLGLLELSLGDLEAARSALSVAADRVRDTGVREPGSFHLVPDYVEVLAGLGELELGAQVLDSFQADADERKRGWALAACDRARGLLVAAGGDTAEAISLAEASVAGFAELPYPLERYRSDLVLGSLHRRATHKRAARECIERAITGFDAVGAPLWAVRARDDLARISGRTRGGLELTETERRVAELVREGLTNREIGDRLFMSPRTVESNLSKVYRKLQVRSRTELTRKLTDL